MNFIEITHYKGDCVESIKVNDIKSFWKYRTDSKQEYISFISTEYYSNGLQIKESYEGLKQLIKQSQK